MEKIYKIQTNQNIFDISLQKFGSVLNIYDIIVPNDLESAATLPVPGTNVIYDSDGLGDEILKNEVITKKYQFANGQSAGSYNNSFNSDFD